MSKTYNPLKPQDGSPHWWSVSWYSNVEVGIGLCTSHMTDVAETDLDDLTQTEPKDFVLVPRSDFPSDSGILDCIYDIVEELCDAHDYYDVSELTPKVCYRCLITQNAILRHEDEEVSEEMKTTEYSSLTLGQALIYNNSDLSHTLSMRDAWMHSSAPDITTKVHQTLYPSDGDGVVVAQMPVVVVAETTVVNPQDRRAELARLRREEKEAKQKANAPKVKQVAKFVKKQATQPESKPATTAPAQKKVASKPVVVKAKSDGNTDTPQPVAKKIAVIKKNNSN